MRHDPDARSVDDAYRRFECANPVSLDQLPDARSPAADALYDHLAGSLFPAPATAPRGAGRFLAGWGRRIVVAGAAAAAIAVALAVVPARLAHDERLPGAGQLVARALAAVSTGPVVHAVIELPAG